MAVRAVIRVFDRGINPDWQSELFVYAYEAYEQVALASRLPNLHAYADDESSEEYEAVSEDRLAILWTRSGRDPDTPEFELAFDQLVSRVGPFFEASRALPVFKIYHAFFQRQGDRVIRWESGGKPYLVPAKRLADDLTDACLLLSRLALAQQRFRICIA